MKKETLKPIIKTFLTDMIGGWFEDKPLLKTLGNSLVDANINKYDNIFDLFSNEHGDIDFEGILNNLSDSMNESYKIDLQAFSPLLPNRILLISKEDISNLISKIHEKQVQLAANS